MYSVKIPGHVIHGFFIVAKVYLYRPSGLSGFTGNRNTPVFSTYDSSTPITPAEIGFLCYNTKKRVDSNSVTILSGLSM